MAADTRQKRFSIMTFAMHASRGTTMPLFEADGTIDQDDRQHLLGMYSGINFNPVGQDGLLVEGRTTASILSGKLVR